MTLDQANAVLEAAYAARDVALADACERVIQSLSGTRGVATEADFAAVRGELGVWLANFNTPGYLPEADPCVAQTWAEARDALLWEVERWDAIEPMTDADLDALSTGLRTAPPDAPYSLTRGGVCVFIDKVDG